MAMNSLKDFSIEWVLFGFLFFSLMTFAITFMVNNNPIGLGGNEDNLNLYVSNIESNLLSTTGNSDLLLNITSQNNPEVSDLGSKDSVAVSYGITSIARNFMSSFKLFMGWIIVGEAGKMLVSVFTGMFGLLSLYFITKWIRQGA